MTKSEALSLALLDSINAGINRVLNTLVAMNTHSPEQVLEQMKLNLAHFENTLGLTKNLTALIEADDESATQS